MYNISYKLANDDSWIPSTCLMCYNNCGIKVHRVNGVVIKIEGDPECPQNMGRLCAKGNSGIMTLYSPHRLRVPLKRTNPEKGIGVDPQWREISWDEALDTIVKKLKKVREEDPRKLVLQSFDRVLHNDFRLHVAYAGAFGTNNITAGAASYFCGNSLHATGYLTNAAFHFDPDLEHCNYLILIGAQHGFLAGEDAIGNAQRMSDARARGLKVVVVDPICTPAAVKADEWLPIRPGTDAAFALAVINTLLNELGIYDVEFIKKHTNGPYLIGPDKHYLRDKVTKKPLIWDSEEGIAKTYDDPSIRDFALEGEYKVNGTSGNPTFQLLKEHVKKYTCEEASKVTTIPAETIRRIAREFGEAARIGSKIVIAGKELPYRPACVYWRKGPNQHKHSMLNSLAIQFMNIVVGSIDVPGGMLGANPRLLPGRVAEFSYEPVEGPDGMMVPQHFRQLGLPYPAREVKPPENATLLELFPVSTYSEPLLVLNLMDPEKYHFPYKPEVLLHSWSNIMMTSVNPKVMAEALKKFAFQVSFAYEIDETVEFADIVLPTCHYLETLNPTIEPIHASSGVGLGNWCFQVRQPVVAPPPEVRCFVEVILEIADRVGFLRDLYHMINVLNRLKEPYKLDLDKKYCWEEIVDNWAKSWFGPEHDLAWFKEHGSLNFPKEVEEVYVTSFGKPRIPLYLEHFIKAGEDVKRVTEEMGISDWDVSDYQPIPDWKPCPAYEKELSECDLFAVNYKLPFHTLSQTANNIWLQELSDYHPYANSILINSQTAKRKGLKDGDLVWFQEATEGEKVKGWIKVTEGVHPEVVGIAGCFGHWAKALPVARGKGIHYNSLLPISLERIDMLTAAVDCCIRVKIFKAAGEQ